MDEQQRPKHQPIFSFLNDDGKEAETVSFEDIDDGTVLNLD